MGLTLLMGLTARRNAMRFFNYVSNFLMGLTARRNAITSFARERHVKIFLISLKAGGVGLNLTAANTVFLLDPWWNPAAEGWLFPSFLSFPANFCGFFFGLFFWVGFTSVSRFRAHFFLFCFFPSRCFFFLFFFFLSRFVAFGADYVNIL
jgi:hypothetical protein